MVDLRWLEKRRQGWYVVVEVPPSLRAAIGRKRLRKTLGTTDLAEARKRRWPVVQEFKSHIETIRQRTHRTLTGSPLEAIGALAEGARVDLEKAKALSAAPPALGKDTDVRSTDEIELEIDDWVREVADKHGDEVAGRAMTTALGMTTPLAPKLELWLERAKVTQKTKEQHRVAVRMLTEWSASSAKGGSLVIEDIDRREAGRFLDEKLWRAGLADKTVRRYVSSYSALWRWLVQRGLAQVNPWLNQLPSKVTHHGGEDSAFAEDAEERAFTNAEVALVIAQAPDRTIRDLSLVAALSGMRLEEIAQLRVMDSAQGGIFCEGKSAFQVRRGKTAAAKRTIPIHKDLLGLVTERSKGKPEGAYLFEELREEHPRSAAVSKRFGRYIRQLGVAQVVEGKRRSLVNFHSFRRWFDTAALQAGQPPHVVSVIMGHKLPGMTLGRYNAGPSEAQLQAVVASVVLPSGGLSAVPGISALSR